MPPKKKEKGGKGGKGAAAAPNAVDEPPQPPPGSPYCLSLEFEVSLLVERPTSCTADAGQLPASGGGGDDSAQLGEEQSQQLVIEPVFRYTFINGEKVTTPPVGLPGSSWKKVDPSVTSSDAASQGEQSTPATPATPVTPATPEASGVTDADGQPEICSPPTRPVVWRYTRTHQLQGTGEDEVYFMRPPYSSTQVQQQELMTSTPSRSDTHCT